MLIPQTARVFIGQRKPRGCLKHEGSPMRSLKVKGLDSFRTAIQNIF